MNKQDKKKAAGIGAGIALILGIVLCRRAHAQQPDKAMLYGLVTDIETGNPISGIDVNCNGYTAKTTGLGNYQILNIEPGTYSVTFTDPHGRYEPITI